MAERIRAGAAGLGVVLDEGGVERLARFVAILNKWLLSVNLVGTTDTNDVIDLHVIDSLAVLPHLGETRTLVDVGSGAGLPGAVLAAARLDLNVTSLEPVHKKRAFQSAVRRELGLANFTPLAERDEQHRARLGEERYDAAVSRATWSVAEWLERGAALVRPGGLVLGMEGREQIALGPGLARFPYALGDRHRAILVRQL